eukprot:CAMPEP_0180265390 /NCGR_PEP_ID=MMETSP0988-20121125/423_1 /TAXON_ID=697907 /ORGANISM="non described non described, Strain CCMP2293" /LENGTH=371 /DNA_ID=CAMNT_0022235865 /DNA_START=77 /DNA_END=1192 /DNA_ORIENTATION=-
MEGAHFAPYPGAPAQGEAHRTAVAGEGVVAQHPPAEQRPPTGGQEPQARMHPQLEELMQGIAQALPYAAQMPGGHAARAGQQQPYFGAAFWLAASILPAVSTAALTGGCWRSTGAKWTICKGRQFDAQLRPKLDELKRQVVTVEERIREVSETRDLLLSEAITEHQVMMEQIHLSSDRAVAALTRDLDILMWDVQRIHDFTSHLAPAPPENPTEVWAGLTRYQELSTLCKQLADKRFKITIEESAGGLQEQVRTMRPLPVLHQSGAAATGGGGGERAAEQAAEEQLAELRGLLEVKDQMVWMMLAERKELQAKLTEAEKGRGEQRAAYAVLEGESVKEQEEWRLMCEGLKAKLEAATSENAQLKAVVARPT